MTAWYKRSFGRDYLALYPHRNEAEADRDVAAILKLIAPPRDRPTLDLCCGAGRHLVSLARAGFSHLTGLDLSGQLLATARQRLASEGADTVRLIQGDMRDIPGEVCYQTILSLFTSFGYFETDHEDARVLHSAYRVLFPGGTLLLDTLNRSQVVASLVPKEERFTEDLHLQIERRISGDEQRVEKTTRVTQPGSPETVYRESVRMYTREEIEDMLNDSGFDLPRFYGSLAGDPFSPTASRMVFVATKARR